MAEETSSATTTEVTNTEAVKSVEPVTSSSTNVETDQVKPQPAPVVANPQPAPVVTKAVKPEPKTGVLISGKPPVSANGNSVY